MPSRVAERINFGKIKEVITPPNLIEIQINSYVEFLQAGAYTIVLEVAAKVTDISDRRAQRYVRSRLVVGTLQAMSLAPLSGQ